MTHVLNIHSSKYEETLSNANCSLLMECQCSRCGKNGLVLTKIWVERGYKTSSGYLFIKIKLAKCKACKARERILPYDFLPGKTNTVEVIFSAIGEVKQGRSFSATGRKHVVSNVCVRKWVLGFSARYFDLVIFYRHRAQIAPPSVPQFALVVRFWAFINRINQMQGKAKPITPQSTTAPELEVKVALDGFFALVQKIREVLEKQVDDVLEKQGEDVLGVAKLGARLFRQAVLLFRGEDRVTPSSIDDKNKMWDRGVLGGAKYTDGHQDIQSKRHSLLAIRSHRRCYRRESVARSAEPNNRGAQQYSCALALGNYRTHFYRHDLSLEKRLSQRWTRSADASSEKRSWQTAETPSGDRYSRGPPTFN